MRALLALQPSTQSLAEATLEPLPGGLSNHAWRASDGDRSCFVRLGRTDAGERGVDRASECALVGLAAAAGIAPPMLHCDPTHGLLVTRYIEGRAWSREDARRPANVARLGARIGELHRLDCPLSVAPRSFVAQARLLEAQLQAPGREVGVLRLAARTAFERLASRGNVVAPCHDDLHHLNIIDDGERLWIVDWEYGGAGDPAYDLASYACQHELDDDARRRLVEASGHAAGGPSPVDEASLRAACIAFDYVQWLWYRLEAGGESGGLHAHRADAIAARILAAAR
ncbi:MAG: phosphotransferase [Steroidobacteraceae bacterium]